MSSLNNGRKGCSVAAFFYINRLCIILSLIHWGITFITDRYIFIWNEKSDILHYAGCKAVLLILLFLIWKTVTEHNKDTMEVLKYAGLYLIPIAAVMIFKLPQGFLSNDENLIFEEAVCMADYTWFSYLTTWYYILSMMLIPFKYAPIYVKIVIQLLSAGYVVKRMSGLTDRKYGLFSYIPFLFFPVLAYTTSAHRIPVYFLLYAVLLFKMLIDMLEKKTLSKPALAGILVLGAVLTQWRTEGIYLLVILPVLLFTAYPSLREKKTAITVAAVFIIIQYIVSIPQTGIIPGRMGDRANNRMGPFYAYTITNMFRNGLDPGKNQEDIERVGRYLDIEAVERINKDLGDINYEDVLILYYPGYTGVREGAETEDYNAYTEGCMNIFKKNPDVFLRTRAGAFNYAALPYHIGTDGEGLKALFKLFFSAGKAGFYNLYIPHIILIAGWIAALIRRRWYVFFASSGLIMHFIIVFILAPASYFKYYFPVYFTVYLYLVLSMITLVYSKRHEKNISLFV